MERSEQKLSLIERLMRVRRQETLTQVEEILIRAEMELRAEESMAAIEKKDVLPPDEFTESNQSWLRKKGSK
ncbi:MAG: hypothetical protein ABR572_04060 [Cryomorphaceae bacterium]|nr:hypothetical protein [Flavobacteriales bacterium]